MAGACTAHGRRQNTKVSHAMANGFMHQKKILNWIDTVTRDLKSIGMAWEEAEQVAVDRADWRGRVAQRVFDTG